METSLLPVLVVVLASVLAVALKVAHWIWWKPKFLEKQLRRQGLCGSSYRLLVGDMKAEVEAHKEAWSKPMELNHRIVPRVIPFDLLMAHRYGKTSFKWVGTTPRVTILDPDLLREVLTNKSGDFIKPPVNPLIKLLALGVSSLEGEEWVTRRKIINPAFHLEKLKGMVPAFRTSCIDMVARWEELVGAQGSYELDVWPQLQSLTGDVISRAAFGSSYEEGKKIFELQKEQAMLVIEASRSPYLPGFRFLPTAKNKRRMFIDKEIKTMLRRIICNKLDSMKTGVVNDDLLSLLLQNNHTDDAGQNKNKQNPSITIDQVIEECKLFYFAGQETTSVLLTWTLILLSMHQDWQQNAREEVLKTCGKNTPDFESINHLKIVNMILHEVLRLYPPVVGLFRHTKTGTKLGDITLPAGVDVLLPFIQIHHDPEVWGDDAHKFNPKRFTEGVSNATKGKNVFFPFGWGPRICLGQTFAMIEAKIALAMILQRFSFELSPSYAHAPYTIITLQPQYGAHIVLRRL